MSLEPRPEVENITVCEHGGPDYSELESLGLSADHVLDFSVCCNPYPLHQIVRRSLQKLEFSRYPDSHASELRQKLAQELGILADNILVGNGTTELIRLLALAYFRKGDKVLILEPTYGEYELASRIYGAEVMKFIWKEGEDPPSRFEELLQTIRSHRLKAIFICQPNNPTGGYFSRAEIEKILALCPDCLLILDEAYINFVNEAWNSLDLITRGNVVILRSMTKDYALAGLRLGYAVAGEDIINLLRRVCPPWNVNVAAQKAGVAVLESGHYLEQSQKRIAQARQFLIRELNRLGFKPLPSKAHFFLVKVGNGRSFRKVLLSRGMLVRDCASFGLPEYIRIAPRTMTECRQFIQAIRLLKQEGELDDG